MTSIDLSEPTSRLKEIYIAMFQNVIEDQMLIMNYSQEVVARESKLSMRSVTPYTRTQVNFLNGNQFFGELNECKMKGSGRYLWGDDMSLYEGEFKRPNVIEGQGIFKFKCRGKTTALAKYCGGFVEGKYHGKGQLTNFFFKYNGGFEKNKLNGPGTLKSGIEYFEGTFENDKKVYGKRVYNEGVFIGEFFDDETKKFGTYEFDNGDVYYGSFLNGLFSGYGEYTWRKESFTEAKYIGLWKDSQRNGIGMIRVEGIVCITTFKRNVKDGPAIVWAKDGKIYASNEMFENDEFISCVEIQVEANNLESLRSLMTIENLGIEKFFQTVSELIEEVSKSPNSPVFPFHTSWFDLKVDHTTIWEFVKNFPKTNTIQESSSISQTIKEFSNNFQEIYSRYSEFSSNAAGKKGSKMTRVGLWQLMRDLKLFKKSSKFNIQETIAAAEREFKIFTLNPDDPFEPVSIAILVQYLMFVVLHINKHHDYVLSCAVNQRSKTFGLFATMIVIFIREFPSFNQSFSGTIYKLIQDDRSFFINFFSIISLGNQKLSIRNVFKLIEMWKHCGWMKGDIVGK